MCLGGYLVAMYKVILDSGHISYLDKEPPSWLYVKCPDGSYRPSLPSLRDDIIPPSQTPDGKTHDSWTSFKKAAEPYGRALRPHEKPAVNKKELTIDDKKFGKAFKDAWDKHQG